jgi:hypothetical protein
MERRQFLKLSGAAMTAATFGPAVALAEASDLSRETFATLQGSWFLFHDPSWTHYTITQLQAVEDLPLDVNVDQFCLLFSSTYKFELPAGLYQGFSQTGTQLQLYLEPAGNDRPGDSYRAYFSLLR